MRRAVSGALDCLQQARCAQPWTACLFRRDSSSMSSAKVHREWTPPTGCFHIGSCSTTAVNGDAPPVASTSAPCLTLYNSLLDEKVPFVPSASPHSRQVSWYTCGPTVYDVSHMGHARNYVSFDIVRRVLEDYFGYNIRFIMNVTDVDDKIITRARRNHLLAQYAASKPSVQQVREFAEQALRTCCAKLKAKENQAAKELEAAAEALKTDHAEGGLSQRRKELEAAHKSEQHKATTAAEDHAKLQNLGSSADSAAVMKVAGDYIATLLDEASGSTVTDPRIYRAHAAKYEKEFFEDMDALGCRRPDVLTRVSEYMPEIVNYVQSIINNGMAYEANGSVYFDTAAFTRQGHTYGKLKPWAVGTASLAAESEANFESSDKRAASDFALWKHAKPGEPFWESPWGRGRPGWHIECSAMASSIVGSKLDIHSGGDDLKFPHHDNELAQAEAYYHHDGCKQWVNYFLHSGHLSIEGLKMSKSLKNFVTIKDALKDYTARQLRLLMALSAWNRPMMYGDKASAEMKAKEAMFRNFFQNVEVVTRGVAVDVELQARWQTDEFALDKHISDAQEAVHTALLDSVDTGAALAALARLINQVNTYLAAKDLQQRKLHQSTSNEGSAAANGGRGSTSGGGEAVAAVAGTEASLHASTLAGLQPVGSSVEVPVQTLPQPLLLFKASAFVTRILSVFGIIDVPMDRPGFPGVGAAAADASGSSNSLHAVLNAFSGFRDEVRAAAKAKAPPGELLSTCDALRDNVLPMLGVRLEDKPDGKAIWKLDDPALLQQEMAARAAAAAAVARNKLTTARDLKARELEKFNKLAALPSPQVALAEKYSAFDAESGEPTHDKEGIALEGKARDKARKELEKLRKVREPLEKKLADDSQALVTLAAEVDTLSAQLAEMETSSNAA